MSSQKWGRTEIAREDEDAGELAREKRKDENDEDRNNGTIANPLHVNAL